MQIAKDFDPGHAAGVELADREGESWTIVLIRELRHAPEKVWKALTDPEELRAWAPYDADGNLGREGALVKLSTAHVSAVPPAPTTIKRADPPRLLEFDWGGNGLRWELEPIPGGSRLTLSASIDRRFVAMGAAGWQLCVAVLDRFLEGRPVGRIVGPEAMQYEGWQRLHAEFSALFGAEPPRG